MLKLPAESTDNKKVAKTNQTKGEK